MPLLILLKKHKPDIIFLHLVTSLPLTIIRLFNLDTEFILRISGFPKLNFFRKFFWKKLSSKIYKITCPTNELKDTIVNMPEKISNFGKNEWEKTKEFQLESWAQMKGQLVSSKNKLSGFFSDLNLN